MKIDVMGTKVCTKCNIEKSLIDFCRSKRIKSGIASYCKDCHWLMTKQWREINKERHKLNQSNFAKSLKGKILYKNISKKYRLLNKDKYLNSQKEIFKYHVIQITDFYIKRTLEKSTGVKILDTISFDNIIKAKREQIKLTRTLKENRNA